jgi:hypothetical protein
MELLVNALRQSVKVWSYNENAIVCSLGILEFYEPQEDINIRT